jgi:hypothetical protein
MYRLTTLFSVLCLLFFSNCGSYHCFHAPRRTSLKIIDTLPKADLLSAIDSITPRNGATYVATMSRIKIFFKDSAHVVKMIPGTSFCKLTRQYNNEVACEIRCLKGALALVPREKLSPLTEYYAVITNIVCGDTLFEGKIDLSFVTGIQ